MIKDLPRSSAFDLDSSIFSSALVIGSGAISIISLIGFPKAEYDFFLICGLALLLINFSLVFKAIFHIKETIGIDAVLTTLLFFFILLISLLPQVLSLIFVFVLALIGYLSLLYALFKSRWSISKFFIWIIFPGLLIIWVAGFVYSFFHHPLYLEKLSLGIISHDQFFHASIAEMFRTYLIPSTGLAGTPYVPYHFGSHVIMAMFSKLLNINALTTYNILFPILVIPLYFRVMLCVVKDIVSLLFKKEEIVSDWIFWGLFIILSIGFIPNNLTYENWAMWDSWMISESYLFSLLFLFLAISVSLAATRPGNNKLQTILYSLLFCVVFIVMGFSKVSVLIVVLGALWYMIIRSGGLKSPVKLATGVLLFAITVLVFKMTSRHSVSSQIFYPLHFVKEWVNQSWRALFVPMFYLTLILYILLRLSNSKIIRISDLWIAIKSKQFIDIEFLLVIAILGFCPAALLLIEGGSAWYFLDIQARVAVVFLAAFILFKGSELRRNVLSSPIALLSVFIALIFVLNNVFSKFEDLVNLNLKLRLTMIQQDPKQGKYFGEYADIYKYLSGDLKQVGEKIEEIAYLPGKIVYENPRFNYYRWLSDTCSRIKDKDQYYIALEKPASFFKDAHRLDWVAAFTLPAITGMALTNGLPASTKDFELYGYASYRGVPLDSLACNKSFRKEILILKPYTKSMVPCD
jgi:hypothetical protein